METEYKEIKPMYYYNLQKSFVELINSKKRNQQEAFNDFIKGLAGLGIKGFILKYPIGILREHNTEITISNRNKLNKLLNNCDLFIISFVYGVKGYKKMYNIKGV